MHTRCNMDCVPCSLLRDNRYLFRVTQRWLSCCILLSSFVSDLKLMYLIVWRCPLRVFHMITERTCLLLPYTALFLSLYPILSYPILPTLVLYYPSTYPTPSPLIHLLFLSFPLMQRALSDSCVRRAATIYEVIFMDYTMPVMVRDPANSTRLSLYALTNPSLLLSFSSLSSSLLFLLL
jgi:hypothetical protein